MNRNTFREFLHTVFKMTDDILMDRIFKVFDTLNNGLITREEWIMGLNIFLRGALLFCLVCKNCLRFSPISLTRQYRWTNKVLLHNLRPQCRRVKKSFACHIDHQSYDWRCKGSSARRRCWQCWRLAWSARWAVCLGSWIVVPAKPQNEGCARNIIAKGKSLALMTKKTDVREGSLKKNVFSLAFLVHISHPSPPNSDKLIHFF